MPKKPTIRKPCDGPCTMCGKRTLPELTEDQWSEVWYALDYKLTSPAVTNDAVWRSTIEEIKTLIETCITV